MDHFAAFGFARRPWLDPEALRERFLCLSAVVHPDKQVDPKAKIEAEKRFAQLNESYNALRQPRSRLLHLLALEGVSTQPHVQSVPPGLAGFFQPIAEQTRLADELMKKRAAATSPMLKVQLFAEGLELTGSLQALQARLAERQRAEEEEIRRIDAAWDAASHAALLPNLQAAAASLGFLERWQAQIQQRVVALAF